jgi:hypothetical protein
MNTALPFIGFFATVLTFLFFIINLYIGSKSEPPSTRINKLKAKNQQFDLPLIFEIFFAHIQAWYLVFIQFIIAYLLIFTVVGRDIITLLLGTKHQCCLALLTAFVVMVYSISIWIIPWHLLDKRTYLDLYRKKSYLVVLRFLGFTSFVVLLFAIAASTYSWEHVNSFGFIWKLLGAYVSFWFFIWIFKKTNTGQTLYIILSFLLAAYFFIQAKEHCYFIAFTSLSGLLFWFSTGPSPELKYKTRNQDQSKGFFDWLTLQQNKFSNFLGRQFSCLDQLSLLKKNTEPKDLQKDPSFTHILHFRGNRINFRLIMAVHLLAALFATFCKNLEWVSPILFVYGGMGFVLILADLMYFTGRRIVSNASRKKSPKHVNLYNQICHNITQYWQLYTFVTWVVFVAILFIVPGPGAAVYDLKEQRTELNRVSMNTYLDQWLADRQDSLKKVSTYPVFIFAGQGGGSRAGYWMSSILLGLDQRFQDSLHLDLKSHTLAISTISGSSPGTLAALAYWEKKNDSNANLPVPGNYCRKIYACNFISSGIAGIFYSSLLRKYLYFPLNSSIKNRNMRLCMEESAAIEQALNLQPVANNLKFGATDRQKQFGWRSFSELYFQNGTKFRTDVPLFFPNSVHVQTGKRVLNNPLIQTQGDNHFANAIDFYAQKKRFKIKGDLAIVQASNMAELFPWVSASAYFDSLGNFVDGGYYENYGLETALDLYNACKDWQKKHNSNALAQKLCFYILPVMNENPYSSGQDSNLVMNKTKPGEGLIPLVTLYATPFSGHSMTAMERVKATLKPINAFHLIIQTQKKLPLTRVLTEKNMDSMDIVRDTALVNAQLWLKNVY